MTKLFHLFTVFFVMALPHQTDAQLPMGKWRTHLSYNPVNQLTISSDNIFGVGSGALFSVGRTDQSITTYSKVTGLHDNNVAKIAYDAKNNVLVIIYANSNIDLVTTSGIINVPDLYRKQTTYNKTVNAIFFNEDYAYLSCNFGIVVLNTVKQEIADTYVIGAGGSPEAILSTTLFNGKIYALSAAGLQQADAANLNLANFQVWSAIPALPAGNNSNLITFGNALWLLKTDGVLYKSADGISWSAVSGFTHISRISADGHYLYCMSDNNTVTYYVDAAGSVNSLQGQHPGMIAFDDKNNNFWAAGGNDGIVQLSTTGQAINAYKPTGPFDNSAWQMKFDGDKLFVVPGGAIAIQYQHPASVSMFQNNQWTSIDGASIASQIQMPSVLDFVSSAADSQDNTHFFIAAYGMGLFEFRNNTFYKWYNSQNSGLESIYPGQSNEFYYIRVEALVFDSEGNLWMTNRSANPVKYLTSTGEIKAFSLNILKGRTNTNLHELLIDKSNKNRKWGIILRYDPAVYVFDDNGTLETTDDDQQKFFNSFVDQDNNVFTSDNYYCIVQDQNNQIWIGTNKGPIVIQNPEKAFSADFTISRIKVPRNDGTNNADYLLGTEKVNVIVVDGANRKWIGTQNSGLYLVSEDGQQTLQHFTVDNSPLLSNTVMSLALNDKTGELFIGTENGIISYMTDATAGNETFGDVYAYPNPVRETYHGTISITGLITNTIVKITDITGNLIYQTKSNGGTATWDGRRHNGARVSTGVYLVFCVSSDGSQTKTTKILVIN